MHSFGTSLVFNISRISGVILFFQASFGWGASACNASIADPAPASTTANVAVVLPIVVSNPPGNPNGQVIVSYFSLGCAGFTVAGNTCVGSLPVGSTCTISVSFTGSSSTTCVSPLMVSDSGGTDTRSVSMYVAVAAPMLADLSFSPVAVNFGETPSPTAQGPVPQTVTITNTGTGPASGVQEKTAEAMVSPFGFYSLASPSFPPGTYPDDFPDGTYIGYSPGTYPGAGGTCGSTLAVGASCTIVLQFVPITVISTGANGKVENGYGYQSSAFKLLYNDGASNVEKPLLLNGNFNSSTEDRIATFNSDVNDQEDCWLMRFGGGLDPNEPSNGPANAAAKLQLDAYVRDAELLIRFPMSHGLTPVGYANTIIGFVSDVDAKVCAITGNPLAGSCGVFDVDALGVPLIPTPSNMGSYEIPGTALPYGSNFYNNGVTIFTFTAPGVYSTPAPISGGACGL